MPQAPRRDEMIHELGSNDLAEATALYVRVFNAPPWNDRWTSTTAGDRLAQALATPASLGLAVRQAGRLVGVALGYQEQWYSGTHYFLKEMFVDPGVQGTGVGTRLMTHLKQRLRSAGAERNYLLTARDSPAAAFYGKLDFRQGGSTALMACDLQDSIPAGHEDVAT